jgi:hypothetical protein
MERPVPQVNLKERRELTVRALCEHFAHDRLELAEFEARLDRAHRAQAAGELEALLHDLPAPAPPPPSLQDTVARTAQRVSQGVKQSSTIFAFMGGVERRGHWTPTRRNVVIAIMGGVGLDFRDVQLPPGETEVFLVCMMGGAEIIVPPDLVVESSGIAIMGAFESVSPARSSDPDAPVLRLNGVCVMGGVEMVVRRPGETASDARARVKAERKALREQRRLRGEE